MSQDTPPRNRVLVTGAASGIGAQLARDFAGHGWSVVLVDIDGAGLAEIARSIREDSGADVHELVGDLADVSVLNRLVNDFEVDDLPTALINAAGIYPAVSFFDLSAEHWDRVQNINVRAPVLLTKGLAQRAVDADRPFGVVNITSGASLRARPGAAAYCVSKSALTMATRACAVELGAYGIRVNAVSPGFVVVDSAINPVTHEYAEAVSENPLGRKGAPRDITGAVRFLLSADSNWVTGAVIDVDGGAAAGTTSLPLHWPGMTPSQSA